MFLGVGFPGLLLAFGFEVHPFLVFTPVVDGVGRAVEIEVADGSVDQRVDIALGFRERIGDVEVPAGFHRDVHSAHAFEDAAGVGAGGVDEQPVQAAVGHFAQQRDHEARFAVVGVRRADADVEVFRHWHSPKGVRT